MIAAIKYLWNHPMGLKTTHFWGPAFNWGFVIAGILDMNKPPEKISRNMTLALVIYSSLFARFAWMITPRNYFLLTCHLTNITVQLNLLRQKYRYVPKVSL